MEILKYKEFEGSAELDVERAVCRGKILHIDDLVTYESKSIDGLQKEFEAAVEDYIDTCKEIGKDPQKPCRGQFNVRVSPELHREAVRRAIAEDRSLNEIVCRALEDFLKLQQDKERQTTPNITTAGPENFYMPGIAPELIRIAAQGISLSTLGTVTQTVDVCNFARIPINRDRIGKISTKRPAQNPHEAHKPIAHKEKARAH